MNWIDQLEKLEKQVMSTVPALGAVKHALKMDGAEAWKNINEACALAENKANDILTLLKNETDLSAHTFIDSIHQSILLARNAKIRECLVALQKSGSKNAETLAATLNSKIVKEPDIDSTELPDEMIEKVPSANANGFNRIVYEELLPYTKLMHKTVNVGVPEEHAYKLAKIFDNRFAAIRYLSNFQKNNPKCTLLVPDACSFVFSADNCTAIVWQQLAHKHMSNEEFRNLLPNAGAIEALINQDINQKCPDNDHEEFTNIPPNNGEIETLTNQGAQHNTPDNETIKSLSMEISTLSNQWKKLGKKKSLLNAEQKREFDDLTKLIIEKRVELSYAYAGTPFSKDVPVEMLRAYYERYKAQASATHAEFIAAGMTSKDYEKFVKIQRIDDDKKFPPIMLDGSEYGYPGVYAMKVPILEEKWASKMARLGKETNCCQSLSGEAGEACTIHLLSSPYGAGFLVAEGDIHNPKPEDTLYAGAWAWRSKKGRVVDDSVEVNKRIFSQVQRPSIHMMRRLAYEYVQRGYTDKVVCGSASGISALVGVVDIFDETTEEFIDYHGYTDARRQLTVYDKARPYYLYGQEAFAETATQQFLFEIFKDEQPLHLSKPFIELLNWAVLEKCNALFEKISHSAGDRKNEANTCIKMANLCVDALNRGDMISFFDAAVPGPLYNVIASQRCNAWTTAAKLGHAKGVSLLLESGMFSPDQKDRTMKTALLYAVESKSAETVNVLISAGANIHQTDIQGESILIKAVTAGLAEIVQLLLDADVDINQKNKYGSSPVSRAASCGQIAIMELLIAAGAEYNLNNLLEKAVLSSNIKTARVLIELGATISESLIEKSAYNSSFEMLNFLINENSSFDKDKALSGAALHHRRPDAVKLLLEMGANPNVRDEHGGVPLCDAVRHDTTEALESLIQANADLNIRTNRGYGSAETPLIISVKYNKFEAFLALLKAGADVNVPNKFGQTPLHCAFDYLSFHRAPKEILIKLLDAGANPNAQDFEGNTPLHKAVESMDTKGIQLLIENGADYTMKNDSGQTPLDLAYALSLSRPARQDSILPVEYRDIVSLLSELQVARAKAFTSSSGLFQPAKLTPSKIKQFLKSDSPQDLLELLNKTHSPIETWIKDEDENYCTLLMHACEMGALKTVKALLEAGADPKKTDPDGDTAAAYAVDSDTNSTEILEVLRKAGLDFTLPNFENETVLDRAKENEDTNIIAYLGNKHQGPTNVR